METDRSDLCGCKGIRTCLKCEQLFGISCKINSIPNKEKTTYVYCKECDKCWLGWDYLDNPHPQHSAEPFNFQGIYIEENFLSETEEIWLLNAIDSMPWDFSQSGRRKQNFGPKCNFKKRKLKLGSFKGFPVATKFIQEKFNNVPLLKDYLTIEQCSLEYDPERGASIDPHIDDCWIWGERIVTVNLLSAAVLTFTPYYGDADKYNLYLAPTDFLRNNLKDVVVRVWMPARSLIVMTGQARYSWEHQIYRCDIKKRRVCVAYREFTKQYLPGGEHYDEGEPIIAKAKNFL